MRLRAEGAREARVKVPVTCNYTCLKNKESPTTIFDGKFLLVSHTIPEKTTKYRLILKSLTNCFALFFKVRVVDLSTKRLK